MSGHHSSECLLSHLRRQVLTSTSILAILSTVLSYFSTIASIFSHNFRIPSLRSSRNPLSMYRLIVRRTLTKERSTVTVISPTPRYLLIGTHYFLPLYLFFCDESQEHVEPSQDMALKLRSQYKAPLGLCY